jgi:LytS/YehU family sensor histidine kinase
VVVDNANGQPGLADRQVGLLPCEWVVDLSGEYGLDCHLPILVDGLQLVVDTVLVHGAEQMVDLGRVSAATQNDHLNLQVVDVQDAIEDRLDVVDLGLDEVFSLFQNKTILVFFLF